MDWNESAALLDVCHAAERAANDVGTLLRVVENPLLYEHHATVSGVQDADYLQLSRLGLSEADSRLAIIMQQSLHPQEVLDLLREMQVTCAMGLFTDIGRAWISIDSRLYIWSYESGSDLAEFNDLKHAITAVHLVKRPLQSQYGAGVDYILVIATTCDLLLHAVSIMQKANDTDEMHIQPSVLYSCRLDANLIIQSIASTPEGRIFLGANDGCVYECEYGHTHGWLSLGRRLSSTATGRPVCRIVNRSLGVLTKLMPTPLRALISNEDVVRQVCIDNARRLLFTRSDCSTIAAYHLGTSGSATCTYIGQMSIGQIGTQAQQYCAQLDAHNFTRLASIAIAGSSVSPTEDSINLVATTNTGVRVYFTCYYNLHNRTPQTLRLVHVRVPCASTMLQTETTLSIYHATVTTNSLVHCMIARDELNEHTAFDTLIVYNGAIASTLQQINVQGSATFTEIPYALPLQDGGEVRVTFCCFGRLMSFCVHVWSMVSTSSSTVHVLTNRRLYTVEVMTREKLMEETLRTHGVESASVRSLVTYCMQPLQASTACVALCCRHAPSAAGANQKSPSTSRHAQTALQAVRLLHMYQTAIPVTTDPAAPGAVTTVSSLVLAFYEHFAQILPERFLVRRVFIPIDSAATQNALKCTIMEEEWVALIEPLKRLRAFVKENFLTQMKHTHKDGVAPNVTADISHHSTLYGSPSTPLPHQQQQPQPVYCSACIVGWLYAHVDRVVQVAQLFVLLTQHDIARLVTAHMPSTIVNVVKQCDVDAFIHRADELCRDLILCLLKEYTVNDSPPDLLCERLQKACPSLFLQHDVIVAKAVDLLGAARADWDGGATLSKQAIALLKPIVEYVQLPFICEKLANANYYTGIVELCAHAGRRALRALGPRHRDDEMTSLPPSVQQKLESIYSCVIDALDRLERLEDKTHLQCMLRDIWDERDDRHLHEFTFDWLLARDNARDTMIKSNSPHLERYLIAESERATPTRAAQCQQLLISYYELQKEPERAFELCKRCAEAPGTSLTIGERRALLQRGAMLARASNADRAIVDELTDRADVAAIQLRIATELEDMMRKMTRSPHQQVELRQATIALNSQLYDISTLYADFAERYRMFECQLALLICAQYDDQQIINDLWTSIIERELRAARLDVDNRMCTQSPAADAQMCAMRVITKLKVLVEEFSADAENSTSGIEYIPRTHILQTYTLYASDHSLPEDSVALLAKYIGASRDDIP